MSEREPRLGGGGADAVEMLVKRAALQRGQGEADIGEDGALRGVEAVLLEVLLRDVDIGLWGRGEGDVAEDLAVELAR